MKRKIDWITVLWWACAITTIILIGNVITKTVMIARAEIAPVQLNETIRRQESAGQAEGGIVCSRIKTIGKNGE